MTWALPFNRSIGLPAGTIMGNDTGSTGPAKALTAAEIVALLAGHVGNVTGPGSSTAGTVPTFADTSGKVLAGTPVSVDADGKVTIPTVGQADSARLLAVTEDGADVFVATSRDGLSARMGISRFFDFTRDGIKGARIGNLVGYPIIEAGSLGFIGFNGSAAISGNPDAGFVRGGPSTVKVVGDYLGTTLGTLFAGQADLRGLVPLYVRSAAGTGGGYMADAGTDFKISSASRHLLLRVAGTNTGIKIEHPTGNTVVDGNLTTPGIVQANRTTAAEYTIVTATADPTTLELPASQSIVWHNTVSGEIRHWVNVGGTLYKSAAYTT